MPRVKLLLAHRSLECRRTWKLTAAGAIAVWMPEPTMPNVLHLHLGLSDAGGDDY